MSQELKIDKKRHEELKNHHTGVFVRAVDDSGNWKSVDSLYLDEKSLSLWLDTLDREALVRTIFYLLGHI